MLLGAVGIGSFIARIGNPSDPSTADVDPIVEIETQQSEITATPIPTGTPLVPINTVLVPTNTVLVPINTVVLTPSNSVEQFIRTYFQEINNRNYEYTWSLLSEAFKTSRNSPQSGGYQGYVDFWNTVDRVETLEIQILEQSSQSAKALVVANYHYGNGATTTGTQDFYFTYDFTRNTWLFDVSG
jgi:hypothetical protein